MSQILILGSPAHGGAGSSAGVPSLGGTAHGPYTQPRRRLREVIMPDPHLIPLQRRRAFSRAKGATIKRLRWRAVSQRLGGRAGFVLTAEHGASGRAWASRSHATVIKIVICG